MTQVPDNNYTIVLHMSNGDTQEIDEWFSLKVAKKIAAKAYDARVSVVNSPVTAIEITDYDGSQIQIVKFDQ